MGFLADVGDVAENQNFVAIQLRRQILLEDAGKVDVTEVERGEERQGGEETGGLISGDSGDPQRRIGVEKSDLRREEFVFPVEKEV